MRRGLLMVVLVLTAATAAQAQTNPCTVPEAFASNPTRMFMEFPEFNETEVDGSIRHSQFQYGLWPEAANVNSTPPTQGPSTVPRSAFTPVAGFPTCYQANLPAPIPTGQRLKGAVKSQRLASGSMTAAESAWTDSNSFGSAPTVLTAPGQVRIR